MTAVARLGDTSSHGGTITSATGAVTANGIAIARLGDLHTCPIHGHGTTPLVTASSTVSAQGEGVVRVGDRAGCGAVITTGSPNITSA